MESAQFVNKIFSVIDESLIAQGLLLVTFLFIMRLALSKYNKGRKIDALSLGLPVLLILSKSLFKLSLSFLTLKLMYVFPAILLAHILISFYSWEKDGFDPLDLIFAIFLFGASMLFAVDSGAPYEQWALNKWSFTQWTILFIVYRSVHLFMRLQDSRIGVRTASASEFAAARKFIEETMTLCFVLLIALGSFWLQYEGISNYLIPTYGNTMYHFAFSHYIAEHGHRTELALEYGGTGNNYYVPCFRYLLVGMMYLMDLDVVPAANVLMILFSIMAPLVFYILGKSFTYSPTAGVFAALLTLAAKEFQIYYVRPLPEMAGLFFIPMTLYFASKIFFAKTPFELRIRDKIGINLSLSSIFFLLLMGLSVTYIHPQSLTSLVFTFIFIGICHFSYFLYRFMFLEDLKKEFFLQVLVLIVITGIFGASYLQWHYARTGTFSPKVLAPYKYHEFSKNLGLKDYLVLGDLVFVFGFVGIYFLLLDSHNTKTSTYGKFIIFSWLIGTFLLTKNEWLGMNSHTERFLAFISEPFIILAAFGMWYMYYLVSKIGDCLP